MEVPQKGLYSVGRVEADGYFHSICTYGEVDEIMGSIFLVYVLRPSSKNLIVHDKIVKTFAQKLNETSCVYNFDISKHPKKNDLITAFIAPENSTIIKYYNGRSYTTLKIALKENSSVNRSNVNIPDGNIQLYKLTNMLNKTLPRTLHPTNNIKLNVMVKIKRKSVVIANTVYSLVHLKRKTE